MSAEIFAIGAYSPAVADFLEYPPDFYKSTANGATVVATLFGIAEGAGASNEFARYLGIADPWNFNEHAIDPNKIDFEALKTLFDSLPNGHAYKRDLQKLTVLQANGFQFIFIPNG